MTLQEFLNLHGRDKLGELVGRFIFLSPDFEGGIELVKEIGKVMGDLDTVFLTELRLQER